MACACIQCEYCRGSGYIWISHMGEHLGRSRCDDLDETETCDECGGSGITQICDECYYESQNEMDNLTD